jgi:two-component system, NarL family, sensor kinase
MILVLKIFNVIINGVINMDLHNKEIQRLQALKEIAELLNEATDLQTMLEKVLHTLLEEMNLQTGWIFFIDENGEHRMLVDERLPPALTWKEKKPMCEGSCWCIDRFVGGRLHKATNIIECKRIEDAIEYEWGETEHLTHHATIPLRAGEEKFGLLNVASPHKTHFTEEELALLEAIAYQIGTTIQRIQLVENERKYVVVTERNRLARDLHDSVKQLLFSIMLTARGTLDMTKDKELQNMLAYIGELSQEALQEMTLLIWQLRPEGLEKGLAEAIRNYGKLLGIDVSIQIEGVLSLKCELEEVVWRISQEALHNCKKHAECEQVFVQLKMKEQFLCVQIEDNGIGFVKEKIRDSALGLKNMRERIELMKGTFHLHTELGKGTKIEMIVPI